MSLNYADEKLSAAVRRLAISPGGIHQRLTDAAMEQVVHIQTVRDMPEPLQDEFTALMIRLTRDAIVSPGEGQIHASVQNMTTEEAVGVADTIVALAHQIRDYLSDQRAEQG